MSYKKECQEKSIPAGSTPIIFSLGIQPNCMNVRSASSPLWFHFVVVTAPIVF